MRRLIYILGTLAFLLIFGVGGTLGYVAYVGTRLDLQAKAYVDEAVPAIVTHWSVDELRRRASPDLLRTTKPDDMQTLFALFSKLGPLMDYEGSDGNANMVATIGGGEKITARFVARATFKNGDASIDIVLLKVDGAWKVESFRVNSTKMLEQAVGQSI